MGGEVTGETCCTALLSGFYNESNVMGPYKATIQQLFFVAGAIQRDPGAAEEVILALCPGSYFYIKSKAVTATVQIYLSSFNHLNILLTAK